MGLDLVIRGATVVTPGRMEAADIGIAGGEVTARPGDGQWLRRGAATPG
jgi:dihydroorotase-like cyclic amidohydrolase